MIMNKNLQTAQILTPKHELNRTIAEKKSLGI